MEHDVVNVSKVQENWNKAEIGKYAKKSRVSIQSNK